MCKNAAAPMIVILGRSELDAEVSDTGMETAESISQIRYSLVVILELNGVSEVQYKNVMMIDDGKYQ